MDGEPRAWEPAWGDSECEWCGAAPTWIDADSYMCRDCHRQAVYDDEIWERQKQADALAEVIAEREEREARDAIQRSLDALNET